MLKKIIAVLLILCLSLPVCALAQQDPKPIATYAPQDIPKTPEGVHHYLLLCADTWKCDINNMDNYTDGIMLVTVDTVAHRIMLTSFIRDMLVLRPDGKYGRINAVASRFGLQGLVDTINSHFGLEIDKYILVDWTDVGEIIDALGGVDITITSGEATRLRDKLTYKSDWTEPVLSGAGTYHFRGYAAVIYMRIRSSGRVDGESYDYRRTTRARNVVSSLADSLRDITWSEATKLATVTIWKSIVDTNMTLADMMTAAGYAFDLRSAEIEQLRIPVGNTGHEFYYYDMATQEIDYEANREALQAFLLESYTVRGVDDADDWDW